jgi:hypothetical protein
MITERHKSFEELYKIFAKQYFLNSEEQKLNLLLFKSLSEKSKGNSENLLFPVEVQKLNLQKQ